MKMHWWMGDEARRALVEAFETALLRELGGARVVDRGLRCDGRPVAEIVLLHERRLVLALAVDGASGRTPERALAARAFAGSRAGALAAHLSSELDESELAADTRPLVLLVSARPYAPRVLERLRALAGPELCVLELHLLQSRAGSSSSLERVLPPPEREPALASPPQAAERAPRDAIERFARSLAGPQERLALDLARRIARIDPGLQLESGEGELAWLRDGELLCCLRAVDGRLEGQLAESRIPHRIHAPAAAEVFLDWVLSLYLAQLEGGPTDRPHPRPLEPTGPLLTPEELEAFRD